MNRRTLRLGPLGALFSCGAMTGMMTALSKVALGGG
jgi:hypothetical protein